MIGEAVQVRFSLPKLADQVVAPAHVRWVDGQNGLGVQFTGLRAREVWALQQLFQNAKPTES